MSYLVFGTFDLKSATAQDYVNAYADAAKIGLTRVHTNQGKESVIPTTSVMGFFNGSGAKAVCADIRDKMQAAFKARGFRSEIFVVVGGDWSWVPATT